MLFDSTVVGECSISGCVVCTKVYLFAINCDPCSEPLPILALVHSSIPSGVARFKSSFLLWMHQFIVIFIIDGQSIGVIHFGGRKFVLDDRTVVGECCFFACVVCTKGFRFAFKIDLCCEPLPSLAHSSISTGVRRTR